MKTILRKFRKFDKNKQVLFSILGGLVLLGTIALLTLSLYLYTYENNHPQSLIDRTIAQYIANDFDEILTKCPEDKLVELQNALPIVINKEQIFAYQSSSQEQDIEYTVVNNNSKLATILLEKSTDTTLFGIRKVTIKSIEHYPLFQYNITYPQDSKVHVNNVEIQLLGKELEYTNNLASIGSNEVATFAYSAGSLAPLEDIDATSYGEPCDIYVDEEGTNFTIYSAIPSSKKEGIETTLQNFTKAYAKYTTVREVGSAQVMQYVKANSPVANNISSYSNTWGEVILSEQYHDVTFERPVRYSETIYSYDVHSVYSVVAMDGEPKDFPIDFTIYVVETENGYAVFDMIRAPKDKLQKYEKKTSITPNDDKKDALALHISMDINGKALSSDASDTNIKTSVEFTDKDTLTIQGEEAIGYVYIKWANVPNTYEAQFGSTKKKQGEHGFLHELLKVPENEKQVILSSLNGNKISEIMAYSSGTLPEDVQDWQTPYEKSDILVFPTHADDDTLYMGALISEYAAKGKHIQTAFLINHNDTLDRPHELLDGMWAMGLQAYPIISDFFDYYSDNLNHAKSLYDIEAMKNFQVRVIRQSKPSIIVAHDENGEYGHGVHMLNTFLLKDALLLANDKSFDTQSYEKYGVHSPSKTYLHLYQKNSITLDVHKKMDELNGLSPFEKAQAGFAKHTSQHQWALAVEDFGVGDCRLFGLYQSSVGYDFKTNDLFEGIE